MITDFADEYGVLSLNALRPSTDKSTHRQNSSSDWISSSAAILPNVTTAPLANKSSQEVSAKKAIRDILEKLSCHSNR